MRSSQSTNEDVLVRETDFASCVGRREGPFKVNAGLTWCFAERDGSDFNRVGEGIAFAAQNQYSLFAQ